MEKEKLIAKLEEEFESLHKKLEKLIAFMNDENLEDKVGETQMNLLLNQESAMQLYLSTLAMRIDDLQASLDEEKGKQEKSKAEDKTKGEKPAEDKEEVLEFIKDITSLIEKYADRKE